MSEAIRDQNHIPVMLGVSSTDNTTPIPVKIDPITGRLLVDSTGGSGYTNLTQFVNQTAWRLFYSNGSGDVIELALGAAGEVLTSAGVAAIPTWNAVGGTGTVTSVSIVTANGVSGSVATATTTPAITLVLGAITPTSVNGLTITTTTGTLTITNAKTLSVTNSITFSGTDATVMTFPTTSATIARTDAAQTFTGVQTMTSPSHTTSVVTASTTMAVYNTTATTVNFAGAATTLNIGAATGTATIGNATVTLTNATALNINGASPSIITSSTATASVFNTNATTGNLFGAATTITIGGTPTSAVTHNYSTNATAAATTKTVNLGTGGAASSTTNVNIGSANGGTTNIASPTLQNNGVTVPTISSTNTLTNKRITKRVGSTTSSATPTINTDNVDAYHLTAQTADITSFTTNLSGTPTDFQQLRISVTGTAARAITWGASFANGPVALPTTTVTTTRLDVLLEWDSVTSKWRCMASGSTV